MIQCILAYIFQKNTAKQTYQSVCGLCSHGVVLYLVQQPRSQIYSHRAILSRHSCAELFRCWKTGRNPKFPLSVTVGHYLIICQLFPICTNKRPQMHIRRLLVLDNPVCRNQHCILNWRLLWTFHGIFFFFFF